jgi:DHA1 family bicyclomycin/chloramphenicol resistance-like MFS transporter
MAVYVLASVGCVLSPTIEALLLFRSLQAIAAGGVMAMSIAVVRDCFEAKSRETVIMITQAIFVVGPILAPIFGAVVLIWFSWRAIFAVLACGGAFALILTFVFKESLPDDERMEGSMIHSFSGLAVVARNKSFMVFMLVCAIFTSLPFNAYLTVSAYIYEDMFGFTPQEFSYFFSGTAALSILGLVVYKTVGQRVHLRHLTTALIAACGVAGVGTIALGNHSAFIFLIFIVIFQIVGTVVKPYSVNILFDIQKEDTGSASSMINCSSTLLGTLGMLPASLLAGNYILSLGVLIVIGVICSAILWIYMLRTNIKVPRIND